MKVEIGLTQATCKKSAKILNLILANEFVVYTQTLNFHWNLKGHDFDALHKFFERLYLQSFDFIDDVAERVQTVGGQALGSLDEFLEHATIEENGTEYCNDQMALVAILLDDHEILIQQIREALNIIEDELNDKGTANFLTDLMEKHEKIAWQLRSFFPDDE